MKFPAASRRRIARSCAGATLLVALLFASGAHAQVTIGGGPSELGFFATTTPVLRVQVVGGTAFVATGVGGLQMIDVSDPSMPTLLGTFHAGASVRDVAVDGITAFVAASEQGMLIVDVSDPSVYVDANPTDPPTADTPLGRFETSGRVTAVAVDGTSAYAFDADEGSLHGVYVADPSDPIGQGVFDVPATTQDGRIAVFGNTLYLAADAMSVVDVGVFPPQAAEDAAMAARVYSVASAGMAVAYPDAYLSSGAQLQVVDLDPAVQPASVGTLDLGLGTISDIALTGTIVYTAHAAGGMTIVDAGNRTAPGEVATLAANGSSGAASTAIAASGTTVFVGQSGNPSPGEGVDPCAVETPCGLQIVDSTLSAPLVELGLGGACAAEVRSVAVQGRRVYAACDTGDGTSNLQVYRVGSGMPVLEGQLACDPCELRDLVVQDAIVYAATAAAGGSDRELIVWNVAGATPAIVSRQSIPDSMTATTARLSVADRFAYVVGDDRHLSVFDALDASAPSRLSNVADSSDGLGVDVSQTTLPASDTNDVHLFDVSAREAPSVTQSVPNSHGALEIIGNLLFASRPFSVIDFSAPETATLIGLLPSVMGQAIAVEGTTAYVVRASGGQNGLDEIDVSDPTQPVLGPTISPSAGLDVAVTGPFVYYALPEPAAPSAIAAALLALCALARRRRSVRRF